MKVLSVLKNDLGYVRLCICNENELKIKVGELIRDGGVGIKVSRVWCDVPDNSAMFVNATMMYELAPKYNRIGRWFTNLSEITLIGKVEVLLIQAHEL